MKIADTWRQHRVWIVGGVVLPAQVVWVSYHYGDEFSREALLSYAERLSPPWFIGALPILPLVGMPISVLLVLREFVLDWGG